MRKKRPHQIKTVSQSRPKRRAHAGISQSIQVKSQPAGTIPKHRGTHANADMRVICDVSELEEWIDSTGADKFRVCQYFIGQKCEQFAGDIFKSADIDLTGFFLCRDSDPNKIHKHVYDFESDKELIGKGIVVKSVNEDYCSGKRVFLLFENLYRTMYSGGNLINNIEYIHNQFERISHYPVQGICIKSSDDIINFKM